MTKFENYLIENGYIKYIINHKTNKFELAKGHTISAMTNIDHRYFHQSDENVLKKISEGKSILDKDFTWDDRRGEICFGLHEKDKPATLIYPRPKIIVKRKKGEKEVIENQTYDDSMNVVLSNISHDDILEAMYNNDIVIEIDLTKD